VAHDTVTRWLRYLETLYYLFELKPFARSVPRSLRREGKLYLWDWSEVDFLLTRDRKPWLAVECKLSEDALSPAFGAFLPHLGWPPFVQVVMRPGVCRRVSIGGRRGLVVSAERLLLSLP